MKIEANVPICFDVKGVQKILNISRSQVYELIKKGQLSSVRIGRSRRVTQDQLVAFINNLES